MRSRKWQIEWTPWQYPEDEWFPIPEHSDVPQAESKRNFKAFGHHVYGDMDVVRLGICLGRSLALMYVSAFCVVGWGTWLLVALLSTSDRSRHSFSVLWDGASKFFSLCFSHEWPLTAIPTNSQNLSCWGCLVRHGPSRDEHLECVAASHYRLECAVGQCRRGGVGQVLL